MSERKFVVLNEYDQVLRYGYTDFRRDLATGQYQLEVDSFDPPLNIDQRYWTVGRVSGLLKIIEMTDVQKELLDASTLDQLKAQKMTEINQRTAQLIAQGFEYPAASGKIFSLSIHSQLNISELRTTKAENPYPFDWGTIDDLDSHTMTSDADVEAFYQAARATLFQHKFTGETLRKQVRLATTRAEIDAVIDNR